MAVAQQGRTLLGPRTPTFQELSQANRTTGKVGKSSGSQTRATGLLPQPARLTPRQRHRWSRSEVKGETHVPGCWETVGQTGRDGKAGGTHRTRESPHIPDPRRPGAHRALSSARRTGPQPEALSQTVQQCTHRRAHTCMHNISNQTQT